MSIVRQNESVLPFLIELRVRLIRASIVLLLVFSILLLFSNQLYAALATLLLRYLPNSHLIATEMMSPVIVPFKLSWLFALGISIPYFFYELWNFVMPALYPREQRSIRLFLYVGISLFYIGAAFAYFVVFPLLFHFLVSTIPSGVVFSPEMNAYLDFTIRTLLMFGLLFEIPMIMVFLAALKVVHQATWRRYRAYAIVAAFVIGMLLAPPDVLSQMILAVPIWLLYEVGLMMMKLLGLIKHEKKC